MESKLDRCYDVIVDRHQFFVSATGTPKADLVNVRFAANISEEYRPFDSTVIVKSHLKIVTRSAIFREETSLLSHFETVRRIKKVKDFYKGFNVLSRGAYL